MLVVIAKIYGIAALICLFLAIFHEVKRGKDEDKLHTLFNVWPWFLVMLIVSLLFVVYFIGDEF